MILELHRQGLKVAAIARQLGVDRNRIEGLAPQLRDLEFTSPALVCSVRS